MATHVQINKSIRALGVGGERAFTLLEILVALSIIFIVMGALLLQAVPISDAFDQQAIIGQLEHDLRRAQSEALREGTRGVLVFTDGGSSYNFGYDYLPYSDPAAIEKQVFRRAYPRGVSITSSRATILFDSRGRVIDENETLTTINLVLNQHGTQFAQALLYPSGAFEISD